jgi:spore coat polysaccharide biosynthesis predicted glycosyltransferase SpsG
MSIVAVHDEGPGVGLGHRRRCEYVAAALRARELDVTLAPTGVVEVHASLVLVDSYRYRADDRARFRGRAVVAIDDLNRDLDVALVVDPAPGASSAPHRRAGRVLAGARYALVDPSLRAATVSEVASAPATVLVTTGAADLHGTGASIAAAVAAAHPTLRVRLVPPSSEASMSVDTRRSLTPHRPGVEVVEAADGLAVELASADVVVTAGGVTLLEALCLGRPAVAVVTAANQRANVEGAVASGAALVAEPAHVADAVTRLVANTRLREDLSMAGRVLVDGLGAERVADAIVDVMVRCAA